jgi:hypothetical protein
MEFSFILTTSILIEKNYSQELDQGLKNVISITVIETKNKYRYMFQIMLHSMHIHFIACYFPSK